MSYIDDEKIVCAIIKCLNDGVRSFVIYPYGTKGKRVKELLNEEFGIEEVAVADNKLSNEDKNILCLNDLKNIEQDYVLLLSSDNKEVWHEIRSGLKEHFRDRVIDIADVETSEIRNGFSYMGKRMQIDTCSKEQIEEIFERTQNVWKELGEKEPYWSVVTHDEFKTRNLNDKAVKKFYIQGWREAIKLASILRRNNVVENWSDFQNMDIVEIGCGCGRITKTLAQLFRKVTAVDISNGNLEIAKQAIADKNVEFRLITDVEDYGRLPETNVVYSYITLQHNCPPIIEYMIRSMLQCLKPHGVAIFQVPTYKRDYQFKYDSYINEEMGMEMHILPQRRIFEIAHDMSAFPLEVHPDNSTGRADESRVFVFEKME